MAKTLNLDISLAGGGFQRPSTSGGQRPSTASRPMSRRGSGVASNGIRPFSRQGSAMANGGRQIGMKNPSKIVLRCFFFA